MIRVILMIVLVTDDFNITEFNFVELPLSFKFFGLQEIYLVRVNVLLSTHKKAENENAQNSTNVRTDDENPEPVVIPETINQRDNFNVFYNKHNNQQL